MVYSKEQIAMRGGLEVVFTKKFFAELADWSGFPPLSGIMRFILVVPNGCLGAE
jgi:hypothetical protein